jgi:hypothetical protein
MADLSPSADGSPAADTIKSPHHTHHELSFGQRKIPRYIVNIFGPFFNTKWPHTTTSGHDSPHPQPTTFCSKIMFILLLFIKDALMRCLLNPPSIHLVEYAASAAKTQNTLTFSL